MTTKIKGITVENENGATKINQIMGNQFANSRTRKLRCTVCKTDGDCKVEYRTDTFKKCECTSPCLCFKEPVGIAWYACPSCGEEFTVNY
jgi:hypothetical protein